MNDLTERERNLIARALGILGGLSAGDELHPDDEHALGGIPDGEEIYELRRKIRKMGEG
jgi:hypothetical protein